MNTKFFIFLCCAIILLGEANHMPADGDRFQTLKLRHNEAPDVCIFDKASASDYPECNILITFDIIEDSQRLGYTSIDFSNSNHKHMVITVFTHQFDPNQTIMFTDDGKKIRNVIPHSLATIQSVIQHELGHAFGLLHYNITDPFANGESGNDRSIMYPSLDPRVIGVIEIKQPELLMLGEMYGTDGWGGYEYPVIIKQCDFTSGFMYNCEW